jgi:sorting nexin-29
VLPRFCKDRSGNILAEHGDILQRWKQYFCDLQSMSARFKELISEDTILNNVEKVPPRTHYEVNKVLKKLKTHKAAGSDNMPAELIKQGGIELKRRIHKLIMKIWKEETLPTEWTEGIICPTYKKDRMICSNYRPITVLNVAYKIFTILINNRLSSTVERKLEDCQMGFRPNRSTIDNIFIVRQIIEKCHEFDIELHNVFIDYTQALYSVYRYEIIKCLNNYDIPSKLTKLITKTLQDTKVRVKVNQSYTENFEILTGVRQGDPLSATLFSIVIDDILKQLALRGNISSRLEQCSAYADDILITARTKRKMIDTFEKLKNISLQFGLVVNGNKIKYMKCTREETQLDR